MGVADDLAPSFTKKPKLGQEDDGNRLVFECELVGSPLPDIVWYRGDTKLVEDERTTFKTQNIGSNKYLVVLELDDVVETDAGLYKVTAKNKMGEVAASISLNFSREQIDGLPPTFAKKPAIRQEDDGKRLIFECCINADPTPKVSWYHDGELVADDDRHRLSLDKDGHSYFSSLEIKNVTVEDAGKYKVTAKNDHGESNATISLNFDSDEAPVPDDGVKPTFTEPPVIEQIDDGDTVMFQCRLAGDPKPTVKWYKGSVEIHESSKYHMSLELDQKIYHLARLLINEVVQQDSGEYRAVAKNRLGQGVATISLTFEGGDRPKIPDDRAPRFPKKPTIRQDGDVLIMEVVVTAHPAPEITWYQGLKVINGDNAGRIRMTRKTTGKDTFLLTLEISNPTKADGGQYRCNALNKFGNSSANISLNFQGKLHQDPAGFAPTFVGKPQIVPNATGTLISLKVKIRAKPKPDITWFRGKDAIKESAKVSFSCVSEQEDIYEVRLDLKDPVSADGGAYHCFMKNEFGELTANLNLNIEAEPEPEGDGPTFVEKPRIQSHDKGKIVIMDCKVKAVPKPTITWTHAGNVIQESSKIQISVVEESAGIYYIKLVLNDPGADDSGLYKCSIKNDLGQLNANLTLNVEIIPVIKEKPKVIKIIKKKTVIVECTVLSKFAPDCTWFKETKAVEVDNRHKLHVEKIKEGEFAVKLEIEQISQADRGKYKLVARNEKGEATSQVVEVQEIPEEPDPPRLASGLKSITVEEGKTAEFLAVLLKSDTKVTVTWYKDTTVIKTSETYSQSFDGKEARLLISSTTQEMTGTYKIVVSSEHGKDESTANLVVEKKEKKKKTDEDEEQKEKLKKKEEEKKKLEEKKKEEEKKKVEEQKKEEEKKKDLLKKKEEEKKKVEEKKEEKTVTKKKVEETKKIEEEKKEKVFIIEELYTSLFANVCLKRLKHLSICSKNQCQFNRQLTRCWQRLKKVLDGYAINTLIMLN
uniref:Ig-like domain-containing protein n=1 Tax=Trichogramma kaykai TaxID=54128 RepID=A0ABD2XAR8_9HYME